MKMETLVLNTQKKLFQNFPTQKYPEIKNFKPPKILRPSLPKLVLSQAERDITSNPIKSQLPICLNVCQPINTSALSRSDYYDRNASEKVLAGSPVMLAVGLQNDRQNCSNLVP